MKDRLLVASVAVIFGATSSPAWASGNEISIEGSALLMGRAGAGRATDDSTAAIAFYNPAGMSQLHGLNVTLGATYFDMHGDAAMTTNIGGSQAGVDYLPHALAAMNAVTMSLDDRWSVGFSLAPTYGFTVDYQPSFPGAVFTSYTRTTSLAMQPAASYALTDWLSVGAGPVIELSHLETKASLPFGQFDRLYDWNAAAGFVIGAELHVTPSTVVGVTYRSEIDHDFTGARKGFLASPSSVELDNPPLVDLGIRQTVLPGVRVYGDALWLGWSAIDQTVFVEPRAGTTIVPRHWDDGASFALGADYDVTDALTVRAGASYSTDFIQNQFRFPDAPFGSQWRYSFGVTYHWSADLSVDLAYEYADLGSNRVAISPATTGGVSAVGSLPATANVVALQLNFKL